MANSPDVFDAEPVLDSWINREPVTQGFFNNLRAAIADCKAIIIRGIYYTTSMKGSSEDVIYLSTMLGSLNQMLVIKSSSLMVEVEFTLFAKESELDEIKNRLSALEGKA